MDKTHSKNSFKSLRFFASIFRKSLDFVYFIAPFQNKKEKFFRSKKEQNVIGKI